MSRITFDNKVAIEEHQEIPVVNKITADNINEIKNVVNSDTVYLEATLVTGSTNIFQISVPGTVQVGDLFHVHIPSSVNTSTAYLKVNDNDSLAIVNEYGTLIKASEISNRYILLVYTTYQSGNAFRYLPTPHKVGELINDKSYVTTSEMTTALGAKEDTSNKVTYLGAYSSDTQYPSAKVVNSELQYIKNSSNLNLQDNYREFYDYEQGDVVVYYGKKYYTRWSMIDAIDWDDQGEMIEITDNEPMVSYIDGEYVARKIQDMWPSFIGGYSQPLKVFVDEQGPTTISCEALGKQYTYSNPAEIKEDLGIEITPGYGEDDFTFVINLHAYWVWIKPTEEVYTKSKDEYTGKRWIDGSPIYRKILTYWNITLDSANVILPNSTLPNLGEIISFSATGKQGAGAWGFLNAKSHPTSKDWDCSMYYDNGVHAEFGASGRSAAWHFNIIIEYTQEFGKG